MCLFEVTIPTNSRFVSLSYRDRFLQSFGCGHCAECMQVMSNQWSYRANYEFDDLPPDAYVMFDCLSYRNKDLPHLSDFWTFIDRKHEDYSCFDRKHLRNFLQLFRTRIVRMGFNPLDFRYYYACEYGTKPHRTHRPHIHIMFYVHDSRMQPLQLSALIAELWKYGRTDGVPYKSRLYVTSHNVVRPNSMASRLRTISYITKYLQKSCEFQSVLDKRIAKVMRRMAEYVNPGDPDGWLESELARRERLKLLRMVNQYHRSSQHFGESALSDMDFNQICDDGCLYMPNSSKNHVKIAVPLPTYYKRKLFYDMVTVDGARYWQLNDLGIEYMNRRRDKLVDRLSKRYEAMAVQANIKIDSVALSKYVLDSRGRIKANIPSVTIQDRLQALDYYNYSTCSDKLQFGQRGLSKFDLGSSQIGYKTNRLINRVSASDFIKKYVILDDEFERQLDILNHAQKSIRKGKQDAFELRQHLNNVYKFLFS